MSLFCPEMCANTSFVSGKGVNHPANKLQPIVEALGPAKTATLPTFYVIRGADNTGSFSGKGKVDLVGRCFKTQRSPS